MRKVNFRALLNEPLLHFLLIGLALFVLHGQVSRGEGDMRRITISQNRVDDLVTQYRANFNRSPTSVELNGLINNYVRDEVLFREALLMGLDKDDAVIRRRVRQKYDLIAEEEGSVDPTDADLTAYLSAHRAKFVRPAVVSFDQIFFDPASTSPEAVQAAKAALAGGANWASFGQPSMLPARVSGISIKLVASDFGDDFARQVASLPVGRWAGPLMSGIGVHLVRVTHRAVPVLPPLNEVRTAVAREWESDRRIRSGEASYRKALANYQVVVKAKLP
jgi:hypothetical protein